ncbi:MAG: hypothetical protein ACRD12_16930 [Acidimicrobiales bacterium]
MEDSAPVAGIGVQATQAGDGVQATQAGPSVVARVREMVTPKRVALTVAGMGVAAWAFEEISWRLWRVRWGYSRAITGAVVRRIDRW